MTERITVRHRRLRSNGVTIHCALAGSGPPLLMLHGYPQTHVMWHRVAPALSRTHTLVCPDLRGYGDSSKPRGVVGRMFDCVADWREVADDVSGVALDSGHFVPEERPHEVARAIQAFLARPDLPR